MVWYWLGYENQVVCCAEKGMNIFLKVHSHVPESDILIFCVGYDLSGRGKKSPPLILTYIGWMMEIAECAICQHKFVVRLANLALLCNSKCRTGSLTLCVDRSLEPL